MSSTPINVGVIGNAIRPKQANRNIKADGQRGVKALSHLASPSAVHVDHGPLCTLAPARSALGIDHSPMAFPSARLPGFEPCNLRQEQCQTAPGNPRNAPFCLRPRLHIGHGGDEIIFLAQTVRAVARPGVVVWCFHHFCPYRVEFDIPHAGHQVSFGVDGVTLETSFPQGAASAVCMVDVWNIASTHILHHPAHGIRIAGCGQEMHVIDHQYIGMDRAAIALGTFLEPAQVLPVVGGIEKISCRLFPLCTMCTGTPARKKRGFLGIAASLHHNQGNNRSLAQNGSAPNATKLSPFSKGRS